jgi:hypothetical protein
MKKPDVSKISPRSRARKIALALSLGVAIGLVGTQARAQWTVVDPTAIADAVQNYADQATRWVETHDQYLLQADHYAQQVEFWQQELNSLQQLNFTLFTMQNQFQKIDPEYGVKDACPGIQGSLAGDITSVLQSFLPNTGGDVVQQQQQLCQMIVMTKNKKYNDTVDYLQAIGASANELFNLETRLMKNSPNPGDMQSNQTESDTLQNRMTHAEKDWQANMTQDQAQIDMLMQMQSILSRRAMGGAPSVMGSVVNAAVLAGALQ